MKIEAMRQYLRYYAREYGEIIGSYTGQRMAVVNAQVDRINACLLLSISYNDGFYYVKTVAAIKHKKKSVIREYTCEFFSLKRFEQVLQGTMEDLYNYMEK